MKTAIVWSKNKSFWVEEIGETQQFFGGQDIPELVLPLEDHQESSRQN